MSDPATIKARRRLIISLTALGGALTVLVGIGTYGLLTGPHPASQTGKTGTPVPSTPSTAPVSVKALPKTTDPETYARAVADALFTWDTLSGLSPSAYSGVLLSDADPSGTETDGLVSDLTNYLPNAELWRQLQAYKTAQTLSIDTISVPSQWAGAVAGSHEQIRPGAAAYTIAGTRHRTGTWNGKPVTSAHPVSFTVFISCPPAFDRCYLLRLSELNTPLR